MYRAKNQAESAFRNLKHGMDRRPGRHTNGKAVKGRTLISFLALFYISMARFLRPGDMMQKALKGIESKLGSMAPWVAVNGLKDIAGGYAKYFDLKVEDGELIIGRKRNAVSFAINREGMFVMFSHGAGS